MSYFGCFSGSLFLSPTRVRGPHTFSHGHTSPCVLLPPSIYHSPTRDFSREKPRTKKIIIIIIIIIRIRIKKKRKFIVESKFFLIDHFILVYPLETEVSNFSVKIKSFRFVNCVLCFVYWFFYIIFLSL